MLRSRDFFAISAIANFCIVMLHHTECELAHVIYIEPLGLISLTLNQGLSAKRKVIDSLQIILTAWSDQPWECKVLLAVCISDMNKRNVMKIIWPLCNGYTWACVDWKQIYI